MPPGSEHSVAIRSSGWNAGQVSHPGARFGTNRGPSRARIWWTPAPTPHRLAGTGDERNRHLLDGNQPGIASRQVPRHRPEHDPRFGNLPQAAGGKPPSTAFEAHGQRVEWKARWAVRCAEIRLRPVPPPGTACSPFQDLGPGAHRCSTATPPGRSSRDRAPVRPRGKNPGNIARQQRRVRPHRVKAPGGRLPKSSFRGIRFGTRLDGVGVHRALERRHFGAPVRTARGPPPRGHQAHAELRMALSKDPPWMSTKTSPLRLARIPRPQRVSTQREAARRKVSTRRCCDHGATMGDQATRSPRSCPRKLRPCLHRQWKRQRRQRITGSTDSR